MDGGILSLVDMAPPLFSLLGGLVRCLRGVSSWRRDVSLLGSKVGEVINWFFKGVSKMAGDGMKTCFWK